ncbi:MAG: hypothetical protein JEZ09_00615 [Salinivirgaceae bacterium]|nr:hypothetical protein [Salinivirgaceae bacterium]
MKKYTYLILSLPFLLVFFLILMFNATESKNNIKFIDAEGNVYKTVVINEKIWMAENLRVTIKPNAENLDGIFAYNNWPCKVSKYGYLYRWKAAMQACPKGWRLPTKKEWMELIDELGGVEVAGGQLKSKEFWDDPNSGATNGTGFSGIAAGYEYNGEFMDLGRHGYYWGMVDSITSFSMCLYHDNTNVKFIYENDRDTSISFSVRYIKE